MENAKDTKPAIQNGPTAPAGAIAAPAPAVLEVVPRPGDVFEYDMRDGKSMTVYYRPLTEGDLAALPQAIVLRTREVDATGKVVNLGSALDAAQIRRRVLAAFRPKKAAR